MCYPQKKCVIRRKNVLSAEKCYRSYPQRKRFYVEFLCGENIFTLKKMFLRGESFIYLFI